MTCHHPRTLFSNRGAGSALALALALCPLAAACGGSEPAPQQLRDHVASEVHVALNRHGVPVEDGALSCEGPAPDGSIECMATTAYEPQAEVDATFTTGSSSAGTMSCPGTLRVTVDGSPLATAPEDPCR